MATAREYITRALAKLGVKAAESSIEASELTDGIETLNDMLTEWEGSGILLGFEPVASGDDEIRAPRLAQAAIKSNLAIRLAPDYSRPVSAELAAEARGATKSMLRAIVKIGDVAYPSTLPTGSGNKTLLDDDDFFDANKTENF